MRRQAHRKGAWLCLMGGRQWQAVPSGHREVKVGSAEPGRQPAPKQAEEPGCAKIRRLGQLQWKR